MEGPVVQCRFFNKLVVIVQTAMHRCGFDPWSLGYLRTSCGGFPAALSTPSNPYGFLDLCANQWPADRDIKAGQAPASAFEFGAVHTRRVAAHQRLFASLTRNQ